MTGAAAALTVAASGIARHALRGALGVIAAILAGGASVGGVAGLAARQLRFARADEAPFAATAARHADQGKKRETKPHASATENSSSNCSSHARTSP